MTDKDLKQNVQNALEWEPSLDASDVGVSVDDGVVTLRGNVGTYAEKIAAERVALRMYGVKAVANDLAVHVATAFERTDTEIAQAAVDALKWNTLVPDGRVTVAVTDGWLTLSGTLEWQYQKDAAARAVRNLMGVKGITNNITVKPRVKYRSTCRTRLRRRSSEALKWTRGASRHRHRRHRDAELATSAPGPNGKRRSARPGRPRGDAGRGPSRRGSLSGRRAHGPADRACGAGAARVTRCASRGPPEARWTVAFSAPARRIPGSEDRSCGSAPAPENPAGGRHGWDLQLPQQNGSDDEGGWNGHQ